jgi:hypothetical protein
MSTMTNSRAEASRRNGSRSRGPVTAEGQARSAPNALKHGMRASKVRVLGNEDEAAFQSLAAAMRDDLTPVGPLQEQLADQIVLAIWRARRWERIETELFNYYLEKDRRGNEPTPDFGLLVIRDRNGARALDTLLRYRGSVQTELFRALAALKALQAQAADSTAAALASLPPPADSTKRTQDPL